MPSVEHKKAWTFIICTIATRHEDDLVGNNGNLRWSWRMTGMAFQLFLFAFILLSFCTGTTIAHRFADGIGRSCDLFVFFFPAKYHRVSLVSHLVWTIIQFDKKQNDQIFDWMTMISRKEQTVWILSSRIKWIQNIIDERLHALFEQHSWLWWHFVRLCRVFGLQNNFIFLSMKAYTILNYYFDVRSHYYYPQKKMILLLNIVISDGWFYSCCKFCLMIKYLFYGLKKAMNDE